MNLHEIRTAKTQRAPACLFTPGTTHARKPSGTAAHPPSMFQWHPEHSPQYESNPEVKLHHQFDCRQQLRVSFRMLSTTVAARTSQQQEHCHHLQFYTSIEDWKKCMSGLQNTKQL